MIRSGSGWAPKTVSTGYLPAGRVTPSPSLSRAGSAGESKLLVRMLTFASFKLHVTCDGKSPELLLYRGRY